MVFVHDRNVGKTWRAGGEEGLYISWRMNDNSCHGLMSKSQMAWFATRKWIVNEMRSWRWRRNPSPKCVRAWSQRIPCGLYANGLLPQVQPRMANALLKRAGTQMYNKLEGSRKHVFDRYIEWRLPQVVQKDDDVEEEIHRTASP